MYQKKSVIHKLLMSVLINNKLVLIPNKLGETATRRSKAATTNPLFDWVFVQSANFSVFENVLDMGSLGVFSRWLMTNQATGGVCKLFDWYLGISYLSIVKES